jgi:hypothetical protein
MRLRSGRSNASECGPIRPVSTGVSRGHRGPSAARAPRTHRRVCPRHSAGNKQPRQPRCAPVATAAAACTTREGHPGHDLPDPWTCGAWRPRLPALYHEPTINPGSGLMLRGQHLVRARCRRRPRATGVGPPCIDAVRHAARAAFSGQPGGCPTRVGGRRDRCKGMRRDPDIACHFRVSRAIAAYDHGS